MVIRILLFLIAIQFAQANVFQFRVPVERIKKKNRQDTAHLWVPAKAEKIRGIVMCGTTLMERDFVRDETIRETCRKERLGLIILSCGLKAVEPQRVLNDLAEVSGLAEIAKVPVMFVGHSAGGPQAQHFANEFGAERCFGLIQYRGAQPKADNPIPEGIPSLAMVGQFDEFADDMRNEDGSESWQRAVKEVASFRKLGGDRLANMVIEPGAGHFAWSDRNAALAALFIKKAAQRGIDKEGNRTIIRAESGITAAFPRLPDGPKAWFFDEELLKATQLYHKGLEGQKDQFIRWKDGHWVDSGARFFFFNLKWKGPSEFQVHPDFAEKYPGQYKGQGPIWPLAGKPAGNSGGQIKVRVVGGPIKWVSDHCFQLDYHALVPAGSKIRGTFLAYSESKDGYRYTEQVGMLPRKFTGIDQGKEQEISFPEIRDVKLGAAIELKASSDANIPVYYYIEYGPAKIDGNKLTITELPRRAKFPIKMEVTAWQPGSAAEPLIKVAEPVRQSFSLMK